MQLPIVLVFECYAFTRSARPNVRDDRACRKCYNHKLSRRNIPHRGRVAQLAEQLTLNQ